MIIYSDNVTIVAAVCACIFAVFGVIGNLITFLALLKCQKLRQHATTAFVLSLSLSDFLFSAFSLPLTAIRFWNKEWTLGAEMCRFFPVIFYGNVAVSLLSMVGITINRYVLISNRNLYEKVYKPIYIYMQLFLIWTVAFLLMIFPYLGLWGELGLDKEKFSCTILRKNNKSPKKFIFLIGFVLPCVIIIVSYSCIYWTVRQQKNKLMKYDNGQKKKSFFRSRDDARITLIMLTIFISFIVCFLPLMLMNVFDDKDNYPNVQVFASILAWASAVINPFIYAIGNRKYRLAYINLFSKVKFWDTPFNSTSNRRGGNGTAFGTDVLQQNRQHTDQPPHSKDLNQHHQSHQTPITNETSANTSSKEAT